MPGYTDFDLPLEMQREARVDLSLSRSGLRPIRWLINTALKDSDQTAAQIALTRTVLDSVKGVRVRGYDVNNEGLDDLAAIEDSVKQTMSALRRAGWRTLLTVHEEEQQIVVMQTGGNDIIEGLSIVVTNPQEVFYINILGELNPEELAQVANSFPVGKET